MTQDNYNNDHSRDNGVKILQYGLTSSQYTTCIMEPDFFMAYHFLVVFVNKIDFILMFKFPIALKLQYQSQEKQTCQIK